MDENFISCYFGFKNLDQLRVACSNRIPSQTSSWSNNSSGLATQNFYSAENYGKIPTVFSIICSQQLRKGRFSSSNWKYRSLYRFLFGLSIQIISNIHITIKCVVRQCFREVKIPLFPMLIRSPMISITPNIYLPDFISRSLFSYTQPISTCLST